MIARFRSGKRNLHRGFTQKCLNRWNHFLLIPEQDKVACIGNNCELPIRDAPVDFNGMLDENEIMIPLNNQKRSLNGRKFFF